MERAPELREERLAAGYGSDDEVRGPSRRPRAGYGDLAGDGPGRRRTAGEATARYTARQSAAGPRGEKVRFLDAALAARGPSRPSLAQVRPRDAFQRHCALLGSLPGRVGAGPVGRVEAKSDVQLLRESHRFLRSAEDDDGSWEARLAQRYYERLFKEYVICDLAGYVTGTVGFRWRTEAEVVRGKGQFSCGHKPCDQRDGLRSYEVDFKYREAHQRKRALVKARLCPECAYKLHYRRIVRAERKRRRAERDGSAAGSSDERAKKEPARAGDEAAVVDSDSSAGSRRRGAAGLAGGPPDAGAAAAAARGADAAESPAGGAEAKRLLEALAWKGPDPALRTREDDFDDFFNGLFP